MTLTGSTPQQVLGTIWTFFSVATILMGMRTAAGCLVREFRLDFWLAWISYIFSVACNIMVTIAVYHGTGLHIEVVSPDDLAISMMWQWIVYQTYVVSHMFGKLAIIALLLQIERDIPGGRKYLLYAVGAILIIVNLGTSSLQWQQCVPMAATWDVRVVGVCDGYWRNVRGCYAKGAVGAAADVFLAIYPIAVFWRHLKLKPSIKIGLCALFGLGFASAACAIGKTVVISLLTAPDVTYMVATLNIYAMTEMWVVLMVSCAPSTKQFFSRVRYRTRKARESQNLMWPQKRQNVPAPWDLSWRGAGYGHQSGVTSSSKPKTISDSSESTGGITLTRTVMVDRRNLSSVGRTPDES